jgi:hypothetical protein
MIDDVGRQPAQGGAPRGGAVGWHGWLRRADVRNARIDRSRPQSSKHRIRNARPIDLAMSSRAVVRSAIVDLIQIVAVSPWHRIEHQG